MVTITIGKKEFFFLTGIFLTLSIGDFVFAQGYDVFGHAAEQIKVNLPDGKGEKSLQAAITAKDFDERREGTKPLRFRLNDSDLISWTCEKKNLESHCGDDDGCVIKFLMHHENHGWDRSLAAENVVMMENKNVSANKNSGIYIHAYHHSMGDVERILGIGTAADVINNWGWILVTNYDSSLCGGGNTAFANPYEFEFRVHPHVTADIIVYDSTGY